MGALLFSLENYIALGMNAMPSTTCTEKLCTWNKPASLKVTPKPISEVQMRKIEYGKTISVMTNKTRENYDCRIPEHREVSRPHLKELYQKMSQCNQSCSWVKFYDEDHIVNENAKKLSQHGQSSVPNDVPDVTVKEKNTTEQIITLMRVNNVESTFGEQPSYSDDTDIESQIFKDTCVTYYSSITPMSEDEVTRIEQKTREQANCAEWMKERKGRITASIVGEICKQRKSTPPDAVIRRIFQYGQNAAMQKPKACQHGQKYESTACEVYTAMMKGKCCDIIVEKRGLVVDKHNPWFGVSIDGIVIDSCDRTVLGIVEIKCPYVNAEKLPDVKSIQVLAEKRPGFFLKFSEGRYTLDKNHNYYYQVQAQMGVLKVKWCDFVVCLIAEIGEGGDVHVERIHFNHKVYDEICTKAKEFYINAVIPERLTERVKRGKPLYPGSTTYVYKKKIPT
ncbi:uncharacterized protein [Ptychodera flava]|uniref:uncharacterized protein n=1 Tax=Ptychodera flava TaxID=63121 RepID=UPI00396A4D81